MLFSETQERILSEIANFCEEQCSCVMCCPEEECVLFRIERIITNDKTGQTL